MKRFGCLQFLFLTLTLISLTALAPASEITESREYWKNFNEETTDFSAAFEQLQQLSEKHDYRDFEIITDEPPEQIPFEDLTEEQGEVSGYWYSGAKCRALVTKDSFAFYEKVVCPKLHKFLKGIASDIKEKTYTFIRDDVHIGYSDYLIMCLDSQELENDLHQLESHAVVLIQSKTYNNIINSKKGDAVDLNVTIYTLPNAYGKSIPRSIGERGFSVYTVVSYNKPDESDKSYRPDSVSIRVPRYCSEQYGRHSKNICCFSPWLYYGVSFETSPTVLYRGEDDLNAVTVSWDKKGNARLEGSYIAKEEEEREFNSPERVKEREEEYNRKMEEERQKAIESMPPMLRTFLFCYPIVVIIVSIGVIAALIYGFLEFLHPTWYLLHKFNIIWQAIVVMYLAVLSCYMSYAIFYRPNELWEIWFTCGFLYIPFFLSFPAIGTLFFSTPEERIQNAIDDAASEIREPGSSLPWIIFRPILKIVFAIVFLCFFGGILLHLSFWKRSTILIYTTVFPRIEE